MTIQPTITLDYDGFPVDHPTATLTFVAQALSEIAPAREAHFGVDFHLSDSDRKLGIRGHHTQFA